MGPFKKYVTIVMAFFTSFNFVTLCQFTLPLPLCYLLNFTKKLLNETKRRFFAYIAAPAYDIMSKEVENHIFKRN